MNQASVLFISPNFSSFVKNDFDILQKYRKVKKYQYKQGNSFFIHFYNQIKLCLWLLKNIWSADKIFCWFADYHSFLPALFSKLFHKELYVVLGGYDVVYLPEINYGSFKNFLRAFCARFTMRYANLNLAVSEYVKKEALIRTPKAHIETVYNGINIDWRPHTVSQKKSWVLTVASGDTLQRVRLKGIDFFCEVARGLPHYEFKIIGLTENARKYLPNIPVNIEIINKLPFHELLQYYQQAKVYCQFSMVESFGMALAESMLCHCIPVGNDAGAIAEIIGDTGYILPTRNIEDAIKTVSKAMNTPDEIGEKASMTIIKKFNLGIREKALCSLLNLEGIQEKGNLN